MAVDKLFLSFQTAVAGRYSLERELGRGGMGVVYLAREVRLDRPVAIKLLPPEFAAHERLRERFLREARTAARLSHPYIVPIHSVDEAGDFVFYVMAYVDGETLAQRIASKGALPPHEATRIMKEVSWALAYAHAQGVVHRDIKPANILLENGTERAMVTDFGIARLAHGSGELTGEVLGTPEYMSPEQASGEVVDGRSDLYSLGVVGFFAATGTLPFSAPSAQGYLAQHVTKAAPPVRSVARAMPNALARVIDQCLEKDPAARPASGEALADALVASAEKRSEIPVPVRVFIDRRRAVIMIMPPIMAIPLTVGLIAQISQHGMPPAYKILAAAGVIVASLMLPLGIVLYRLRSVMRQGYGPEDIAAGLRARYERMREEFNYEFGDQPSIREKLVRAASIAGVVGAAGLGVGIATGAVTPYATPFIIMAGYASVIAGILTRKWSRLRRGAGSGWVRFWEGGVGRGLAKLASVKLGRREVPANRPTELAIAMSAEGLFDSLPKEMRESLGDVPSALHALEAHARAARAQLEELDATSAEAQRGPGSIAPNDRKETLMADLRASRTAAEARLAEVVTALENVRLDLLRLHAGAGSLEGVTQDLEAARALSEGAERLLAGAREVDEALRRTTPA